MTTCTEAAEARLRAVEALRLNADNQFHSDFFGAEMHRETPDRHRCVSVADLDAALAPSGTRVPDDLWHAAQARAAEQGTTVADVIRRALRRYVKHEERKP